MGGGRGKIAARSVTVLAVAVLLAVSSVATAEEYSRRIAIAPFTILGPQEEIRQTVDILPRLLSSRLMALAGAEVLLLPRGDKSPEESARGAGLPLLLKGSVAKLGAGYSIDVTVTEPPTGKMAGAFFASAANEDEIIFRLGDLAAEISEKLFGVKTAARTYPPPPAAQPPAPPSVAPPPTAAAALPPVQAPAAPAALATQKEAMKEWTPTSIKKISQSGKIVDELYGVVAVSGDDNGNGEIAAWGKNVLYFYKIKGAEILPFTRISMRIDHHLLNVASADVDGDGTPEILVNDLVGDDLQSFVLKKQGEVYREVAGKIPYFLVVLPDWLGKKAVVGQRVGFDSPFQGRLYLMAWDGKTLVEKDSLSADTNILPLSAGVLGLSSARFGKGWNLVYTDEYEHLRLLDATGKSEYKSREKYGSASDFFEWGPYLPLEGKRRQYFLRKPVNVSYLPEGRPLFIITEVKRGILSKVVGSHEYSRIVLLQWDGGEFVEKAGTQRSDHFYSGADYFTDLRTGKGGKVIASSIEQVGTAWSDKASRLILFGLE